MTPKQKRETIKALYKEGFTYQEIANKLGLKKNTVGYYIARLPKRAKPKRTMDEIIKKILQDIDSE